MAAFADVLPSEGYVTGKFIRITIEQNNSNTRPHSGICTRRTNVVSKKKSIVDLTLRLWHYVVEDSLFGKYQAKAMSIFK